MNQWPSRLRLLASLGYGVIGLVCLCRVLAVEASVLRVSVATAGMVGLYLVQRHVVTRAGAPVAVSRPRPVGLLAAGAVLVFLPLPLLGEAWLTVSGVLAGIALVAVPGRFAGRVVLSFSIAVAMCVWIWPESPASSVAASLGATAVTLLAYTAGIIIVAGAAAGAVHHHRCRFRMAGERQRFARDLHDLLGYSLSAVTLKAEVATRLLVTDPVRARRELTEAIHLSRQAAADVRTVAYRYRELSLAQEIQSARSLLAAAGLRVSVDTDAVAVPQPAQTVLATVLREGTTNLLRHSAAATCRISLRSDGDNVYLELANDGVPARRGRSKSQGAGVENLAARLRTVHGEIVTRLVGEIFIVRASIPLVAAAPHRSLSKGDGNARIPSLRTGAGPETLTCSRGAAPSGAPRRRLPTMRA